MDEDTPQLITALTFILLGVFILADQLSLYFGINLTQLIRPLFLVAGIFALIAGITLLIQLKQEE